MCRITQLLRPPQLGFYHPERRKVDNVLDPITMYSSLHTASCMAYPPVRRQKRHAFMPLNPSVRVHRNPAIGSGEPGEAKTWLACFMHSRLKPSPGFDMRVARFTSGCMDQCRRSMDWRGASMGSDRHWLLPLWRQSLVMPFRELGCRQSGYLDHHDEQNHIFACMMHADHDIIQSDASPECVQRKPKPTLACG